MNMEQIAIWVLCIGCGYTTHLVFMWIIGG